MQSPFVGASMTNMFNFTFFDDAGPNSSAVDHNSSSAEEFEYDISNLVHMVPDPTEMLSPWAHNPMFTPILTTYSITFFVGVVANLLAIAALMADKGNTGGQTTSGRSVFLISTLTADVVLLAAGAPLQTAAYFVVNWDENGIICKAAVYVEFVAAVAVVMNLTAVSLERFLVIAFPLKSRTWCTKKNCIRSALAVWTFSALLAIPNIRTKETIPMAYANNQTLVVIFQCLSNEEVDLLWFAFTRFLVLFLMPAVIMALCYGSAVRHLWRSINITKFLTNSRASLLKPSTGPSTCAESSRTQPRSFDYPSFQRSAASKGLTESSKSSVESSEETRNCESMSMATLPRTSSHLQRLSPRLDPRGISLGCMNYSPASPRSPMGSRTDQNEERMAKWKSFSTVAPKFESVGINCSPSLLAPQGRSCGANNGSCRSDEPCVSRFISHQPGAVGHESGGQLLAEVNSVNDGERRGSSGGGSSAQRLSGILEARNRVKTMLLVHIVLFMVCWGPRLLWDVAIQAIETPRFSNATYALRVFFFLLPFVHSATNPILYFFMSSSLRRSLVNNVLWPRRRPCARDLFDAATTVSHINRAANRFSTRRENGVYSIHRCASNISALNGESVACGNP